MSGTGIENTELNDVSGTGIQKNTELTDLSGTGIEKIPNLSECRVEVSRSHRINTGTPVCFIQGTWVFWVRRIKLVQVSGTGIELVLNLTEVSGTAIIEAVPKIS